MLPLTFVAGAVATAWSHDGIGQQVLADGAKQFPWNDLLFLLSFWAVRLHERRLLLLTLLVGHPGNGKKVRDMLSQ